MADRPLGMAHVTDTQLARLARSIKALQVAPASPPLLPVRVVRAVDAGFALDHDSALDGAEVFAVKQGVRVARLVVLPAGFDCC